MNKRPSKLQKATREVLASQSADLIVAAFDEAISEGYTSPLAVTYAFVTVSSKIKSKANTMVRKGIK